MKAQLLIFAAAFWLVVLAAYSDTQMQQLVKKSGVIDVTDDNFEKLIYGERDYHIFLLMLSDSALLNCALCVEVHPTFGRVGSSWKHFHPNGWTEEETEDLTKKNVYFLEADYLKAKRFFQIMQLESIPKIFYFPPSGPDDKDSSWMTSKKEYQFYQGDHTVLIAQWVQDVTGYTVELFVPADYTKVAVNAVITFVVVMLMKKFSKQVGQVLGSTFVWGSLSLVAVLLFNSGYMFNQIRSTPFVKESERGTEYFAPSQQMQYGLETQVVSSLYGFLALVFVLLVNKVSKISNAKVQFFAVVTTVGLIYAAYSLYVFLFAFKSKGYPYTMFDLSKY